MNIGIHLIRHQSSFILTLLLMSASVSGCYVHHSRSYREIMQDAAMTNIQDGVDADEASLLAQNAVVKRALSDRLHSLEPFDVFKRHLWRRPDGSVVEFIRPPETFDYDVEEHWRVLFRDKEGSFLGGLYPVMPFYVDIDAKSGHVIDYGLLKEEPIK